MDQIEAIKTIPTAIPSGIPSQDGSSDCLNHGSDRNFPADVTLVKNHSSASMLRRFEAALGEELTLEFAQCQEQEARYIAYERGDGEGRGINLVPPQPDFGIVICGNADDDKTIGHPEDILIPIPSGIPVISVFYDEFDIGVPWTLPDYPDTQGTYTSSNSLLPAVSNSFYEPPVDVGAMSLHTTQPQPLFQSKHSHSVIEEIVREEDGECYDEDLSDVLGRLSDLGIVYYSSHNSSGSWCGVFKDEETEEIEHAEHYHSIAPQASNNDSMIAHSGSVYLNDACTYPWPQLQSNFSFISNPRLPADISESVNRNHRLVESDHGSCCDLYGVEDLTREEETDHFESAYDTETIFAIAPEPLRLGSTHCGQDRPQQSCRLEDPLADQQFITDAIPDGTSIPERSVLGPMHGPHYLQYMGPTLMDIIIMYRAQHRRRNLASIDPCG